MGEIVHIAGAKVEVGGRWLRQLCAWCGYTLIDYDLTRIAVPVGQDQTPPTWTIGALVAVDGSLSEVRDHVEGADLPGNACAVIEGEGP